MLLLFLKFSKKKKKKKNQKRSCKEKHFVFITKMSDVKISALKNSREQKNPKVLTAMVLISNFTSTVKKFLQLLNLNCVKCNVTI